MLVKPKQGKPLPGTPVESKGKTGQSEVHGAMRIERGSLLDLPAARNRTARQATETKQETWAQPRPSDLQRVDTLFNHAITASRTLSDQELENPAYDPASGSDSAARMTVLAAERTRALALVSAGTVRVKTGDAWSDGRIQAVMGGQDAHGASGLDVCRFAILMADGSRQDVRLENVWAVQPPPEPPPGKCCTIL